MLKFLFQLSNSPIPIIKQTIHCKPTLILWFAISHLASSQMTRPGRLKRLWPHDFLSSSDKSNLVYQFGKLPLVLASFLEVSMNSVLISVTYSSKNAGVTRYIQKKKKNIDYSVLIRLKIKIRKAL